MSVATSTVWFHGTPRDFERFALVPSRAEHCDWNTHLGVHFSADEELARGFVGIRGFLFAVELPEELHHGGCELGQMQREAAELALTQGVVDARQLEATVHADRFAALDDKQAVTRLKEAVETEGPSAVWREEFERPLSWALSNEEEIRQAVADCYREYLQAQGYRGVRYLNAFEICEGDDPLCAVVFDPADITIIERVAT